MTTSPQNGSKPELEGTESRSSHTAQGPQGINRRTIVQGAAWSIPVVAVAVGAPLAAASPAPTLTFTNGPYSVAACGTLKDVIIKATTDGTTPAPAGTLVTVSLPAGLTWSDGTTGVKVLPTNGNGEVVLTGLKATSAAGTVSIGASTSTSTTSAPVTVTSAPSTSFAILQQAGSPTLSAPVGVPAGSTPVSNWLYLAPNGNLIDSRTGTIAATGVASVGQTLGSGTLYSPISFTDGSTAILNQGSSPVLTSTVGVPSGSTAVSNWLFLAPNGDLIDSRTGTIAATGVASVGQTLASGGSLYSPISFADGSTAVLAQGSSPVLTSTVGVPAGSTPVSNWLFLAPNGNLIDSRTGTIAATGVASVGQTLGSGTLYSPISFTDGSTAILNQGSSPVLTSTVGVPSGSTAVSNWLFLAPNGDLIDSRTGTIAATGVASVGQTLGSGGSLYSPISFTPQATC